MQDDESATAIRERLGLAEQLRSEGRDAEAIQPLTEAFDLAGPSTTRDRVIRNLGEIYYEQGDYAAGLEVLRTDGFQRELHDDLILAKCYFHEGRVNQARREFMQIQELDLYDELDLDSLRIAGLSYYDVKGYRQARTYLGHFRERAALEELPEDVHDALLDSARQLYQQWSVASDRDQRRDEALALLTQILDLEPEDHFHRQQIGLQRYAVGVAQHREDLFRQAYEDLTAADRAGEHLESDEEQEIFGRLVACYGDLLPLAKNNTWVYTKLV